MRKVIRVTLVAGGVVLAARPEMLVKACERVAGPVDVERCDDVQDIPQLFTLVTTASDMGSPSEDGTVTITNNTAGDEYVMYSGETQRIVIADKGGRDG